MDDQDFGAEAMLRTAASTGAAAITRSNRSTVARASVSRACRSVASSPMGISFTDYCY